MKYNGIEYLFDIDKVTDIWISFADNIALNENKEISVNVMKANGKRKPISRDFPSGNKIVCILERVEDGLNYLNSYELKQDFTYNNAFNFIEFLNCIYTIIHCIDELAKIFQVKTGEITSAYDCFSQFDYGEGCDKEVFEYIRSLCAVHKTKELDDNSPSKNDRKDPRVIAGLVRNGRYFYSYMPTGVYAELRNASNRRFVLVEEQTRTKNHLQKWIAVYFPEYKGVYTHIDAKGGLLVLKEAPTPEKIVKLGEKGIIKIWKDAKLRGNGHKKVMNILNAAMRSIGLKAGLTEAWMEIQDLIEDYELQTKRLERVNDLIKELCQQIRYADKLLEIKGIGITTVAGFIAEVGDITRFDSTKELQKLARLELVAESSG